jgi:predicted amidophosphoribosyltransferase
MEKVTQLSLGMATSLLFKCRLLKCHLVKIYLSKINLAMPTLSVVHGLQLIRVSLPNRCLLCQQRIAQQGYQQLFPQHVLTGLCQDCLISGLYQHDVCLGCAKPLTRLQPYCGQCMAIRPIKVIAPCSYHQGLGTVISAIKYQRQLAAVNVLADQLAHRVLMLVERGLIDLPQVLIPVPLHPKRLQYRGLIRRGLSLSV